jgi:hypothetical protein
MKYLFYPLVFIASLASGQAIDIEKTYDVSKEAMKGFIHLVNTDIEKRQIDVVYRVRAKKSQSKFITYSFDMDFNFLNQSEELIDMEKELPTKYRPKKYRGEDFSKEGLAVEPNLMGTLVLKRKITNFNWSWFRGDYSITTNVAEKLKVKTDDNKKLFYHDHIEDNTSGTAMVLAGEKGGPKNGPFNHMMNFHFLKYDVNLTTLADVTLNFETPQSVVATYGYPTTEDDPKSDMIVIFAPTKVKNYVGPKIWNKSQTEYTYVRVSYEGKLLDKISFTSPNSIWRVDDFVLRADGSVYFYGPSNDEQDEYFISRLESHAEKKKWPRFQLAKIDKGRVEFVTSTSMDDFEAKLKPQPNGKKGESYNGRRVEFNETVISPNGDFILAGQNYGMMRNGKGQVTGRAYEDLVMFHFDSKGNLVSQYTVNKKFRGTSADGQFFEFSPDGKTLFWTYFDVVGTKAVRELSFVVEKPLGVPKLATINLTTGSFDKYTEYGNGDNYVHYGGITNYFKYKDANKVAYFGENKKGSSLWFARINIDK